jgi:hypothetical protein
MSIRTAAQRKADLLESLYQEKDAWVSSASANGDAYLIPLSYIWDGSRLIFATLEKSTTTRNLRRAGRTRVALPSARDVVIIDGLVSFLASEAATDSPDAEEFATRLNWDPRDEPEPYVFFFVTPERIQAWRNVAELTGRQVMKNGVWQDDAGE